jgi:hypothetical protein
MHACSRQCTRPCWVHICSNAVVGCHRLCTQEACLLLPLLTNGRPRHDTDCICVVPLFCCCCCQVLKSCPRCCRHRSSHSSCYGTAVAVALVAVATGTVLAVAAGTVLAVAAGTVLAVAAGYCAGSSNRYCAGSSNRYCAGSSSRYCAGSSSRLLCWQ